MRRNGSQARQSAQRRDVRPCAQAGGVVVPLVVGLSVLLAMVVVGFLLLDRPERRERVPVGVVAVVPAATYRDVVLGVDREALTERLLPARPVDADVLERASAGPPDAACVYYRAADRADGLYRFCFEDDRLVSKSMLPLDAP